MRKAGGVYSQGWTTSTFRKRSGEGPMKANITWLSYYLQHNYNVTQKSNHKKGSIVTLCYSYSFILHTPLNR
jgi:hypothetical protein